MNVFVLRLVGDCGFFRRRSLSVAIEKVLVPSWSRYVKRPNRGILGETR